MQTLWRISAFTDLNGMGGELTSGRWHTAEPGKRIVYFGEHPAVCLVESVVNLRGREEFLPGQFQLLRVELPKFEYVSSIMEASLPDDWRESPAVTRSLGDDWLTRGESALLAVPSASSPESTNYLLNPKHPEASEVLVAWSKWVRYDRRLFRTSE